MRLAGFVQSDCVPRTCRWALMLLVAMVLWVAGPTVDQVCAAAAASAPAPSAEANDAAGDAMLTALGGEPFEVELQRITLRRELVRQRDDGLTRSRLTITLRLPEMQQLTFQEIRNVDVSDTQTAGGERLRLRTPNPSIHGSNPARRTIALIFDEPREKSSAIPHLTGTMEVLIRRNQPRYVSLGPLEEIRGKNIRLPEYGDARITVGEMADGTFAVRYEAALSRHLTDRYNEQHRQSRNTPFALYDAQGELLSYPRAQLHSPLGDSYVVRVFPNVDPPADGYLELAMNADVGWVELPISVRDIPLPQTLGDLPEDDESEQP